jgi:hypothetical protein
MLSVTFFVVILTVKVRPALAYFPTAVNYKRNILVIKLITVWSARRNHRFPVVVQSVFVLIRCNGAMAFSPDDSLTD